MFTVTSRTTYRVDHSAISNMTLNPTGMVSSMTNRVAEEIKEEAMKITRRETNKSRASRHRTTTRLPMWASYTRPTPERRTPTNVVWRISNTSGHAVFVLKGTRPVITSKSGRLMPVGKSQMGLYGVAKIPKGSIRSNGIRFENKVRGQRGRNFMMQAVRKVYIKEGL